MKIRRKIWQIRKIAVPLHPLFVSTSRKRLYEGPRVVVLNELKQIV